MKKNIPVSEQLKTHRMKKKMAQNAFASWLGINAATYRNLEQGRNEPSGSHLRQILGKIQIR